MASSYIRNNKLCQKFEMSHSPPLVLNEVLLDILAGRDRMQNEPNLKSVQCSVGKLLHIFEVSNEHKCKIITL